MLILSSFSIVNHLKSDVITYIAYFDMQTIINQKVINYKILNVFKLNSFDIKCTLIKYYTKKFPFYKTGYHNRFMATIHY